MENVPAVSLKALAHIFREGNIRGAVNGNVVIIVKRNEFTQTQVTRQGASFTGYAFHVATIAEDDIGVMIHQGAAGLVKFSGQVCLCHG